MKINEEQRSRPTDPQPCRQDCVCLASATSSAECHESTRRLRPDTRTVPQVRQRSARPVLIYKSNRLHCLFAAKMESFGAICQPRRRLRRTTRLLSPNRRCSPDVDKGRATSYIVSCCTSASRRGGQKRRTLTRRSASRQTRQIITITNAQPPFTV